MVTNGSDRIGRWAALRKAADGAVAAVAAAIAVPAAALGGAVRARDPRRQRRAYSFMPPNGAWGVEGNSGHELGERTRAI